MDGADADGDGIIDKQEMKELMQTLGKDVDDTAIEEILRKADTDGDGVVDVAEVVSLVQAEETAIVAAEDIAEVLEPTRRKSLLSKLTGGKFGEVRRVALSSPLLSVPYFRSH